MNGTVAGRTRPATGQRRALAPDLARGLMLALIAVVNEMTYLHAHPYGLRQHIVEHGYLLKDAGRETLFAGIRAARAGIATFSPSVSYRVTHPAPPPVLSAREIEVLRLVAEGRTIHQIAAALFIGGATVKTHLQHIFVKLDVPDRAVAVAAGHRLRLLP